MTFTEQFSLTPTQDISGTSYQSSFKATPDDLVAMLGDPHDTSGDKTSMEWAFRMPSGDVFTVYDYKTYGWLPGNKVYDWHIGAHSRQVADNAVRLLTQIQFAYDNSLETNNL